MKGIINGLPLFEALIDSEDTGMMCISLVDAPAVESNFVAFDADKKVSMYCVADEEKRVVRGVVMRANFPIYRYSPDMGEYYIMYSAETIRIMAEKYLAESRQNNTTLHHIAGSIAEGINLVQYFIKDTAKGIAPLGFEDIEDGSLFAEYQVRDEELWHQIKCGTFKGFSLEGVFAIERVGEEQPNFNKQNMSRKQKLKEMLAKLVGEAFAQITTDKGILRWDSEEDLKVGDDVFYITEEGEDVKPEDGDYITEDGKTIKVEDGKVVEIIEKEEDVEPTEEEVAEEMAEQTAEETLAEDETPAEEDTRVADIEAKVAELNERISALEALVAEKQGEAMSEVEKLRAELSKPSTKGIAQTFEEQTEDVPSGVSKLAKLRENALK